MASSSLKALRVLVVEDEMLVAMNIEDMLLDLGHEVAGLAGRVQPAPSLARGGAGGGGARRDACRSRSRTGGAREEARAGSVAGAGGGVRLRDARRQSCRRSELPGRR